MTENKSLESALPYLASDLEWVIFSPSLLKDQIHPDLSSLPQSRKIVENTRKNPAQLAKYLSNLKRHTLGSYFEMLIFYWLDQLDEVELYGSNLQIRDGKQTVGELDALFSYKGQNYHWELTVKFYAAVGNKSEESSWVGPLKKDNLERKLNRLYDHQLPLAQSPTAADILENFGISKIQSSPYVKGILFSPAGTQEDPHIRPERVSRNSTHGFWAELCEISQFFATLPSYFCPRQKNRWFSTLRQDDWIPIENEAQFVAMASELLQHYSAPQQLSFGEIEGGEIREQFRLFLMQDDWKSSS